jgi:hypothetical protein
MARRVVFPSWVERSLEKVFKQDEAEKAQRQLADERMERLAKHREAHVDPPLKTSLEGFRTAPEGSPGVREGQPTRQAQKRRRIARMYRRQPPHGRTYCLPRR